MKRPVLTLIGFIFITLAGQLWAQDLATPIAPLTPQATPSSTVAAGDFIPATMGGQNPYQAEAEKAPVTSRPTEVPKFSLPDVVITGENELTIGAKRSSSVENDVSWGAQNLSQINRSTDDLPGLGKSLTALSTQETGPSQDMSLILHGGGGTPGTLGGWGLLGMDFTDMQYLLSGYYSTWSGQPTNGFSDGDQKYSFGGEFKFLPQDNTSLRLSLYSSQVDATLPYQGALEETHQGLHLNADFQYKWSNIWRSEIIFDSKITTLDYWDQTALNNQVGEFEGRVKFIGEEIDPFWNSFTLEAGDNETDSNFSAASNPSFNLAWVSAQTRFVLEEDLDLTASLEGQSGSGPDFSSKLFPAFDLRWRFWENTQLAVYWKTARDLKGFFDTYMDMEHSSPQAQLPTADEVTGEWGVQFTQRINENIVAHLGASSASIVNYHQWTDINPMNPDDIETYSTLPAVQINKAAADIEWQLDPVWKVDANYQWLQGINNSNDALYMTFLPQNQGAVALTRTDDQWETTLTLIVVSDREALDAATLDLPAYATLNLSAAYHVTRGFSLWLDGDNLLGASYMLEPGYLEPQYHVRGGVEVIF